MTNRLFDQNELVRVLTDDLIEGFTTPDPADSGRDEWTIGHDLVDSSGAYALSVSDTCNVGDNHALAGTVDGAPEVYQVKSFGAIVEALRKVRCSTGEEERLVGQLLDGGGLAAAAEWTLWNGVPGWDASLQPSLQNTDVQTVAVGTSVADTLAAAVVKYAQLTVFPYFVVHLGVKSALDLSATGSAYADGSDPNSNTLRIRAVDAPAVVSPYYPADGVAVTGPLTIRVGKASAWQQYDYSTNRFAIRGYRLLEIDFNPSTSVRAV